MLVLVFKFPEGCVMTIDWPFENEIVNGPIAVAVVVIPAAGQPIAALKASAWETAFGADDAGSPKLKINWLWNQKNLQRSY